MIDALNIETIYILQLSVMRKGERIYEKKMAQYFDVFMHGSSADANLCLCRRHRQYRITFTSGKSFGIACSNGISICCTNGQCICCSGTDGL
jgi:hypothetical protein